LEFQALKIKEQCQPELVEGGEVYQAQHDSASTVLRQAQHDSASTVLRQAQHDSAKCFDRLSMTAQMVAENTNHGGNGRIECG